MERRVKVTCLLMEPVAGGSAPLARRRVLLVMRNQHFGLGRHSESSGWEKAADRFSVWPTGNYSQLPQEERASPLIGAVGFSIPDSLFFNEQDKQTGDTLHDASCLLLVTPQQSEAETRR